MSPESPPAFEWQSYLRACAGSMMLASVLCATALPQAFAADDVDGPLAGAGLGTPALPLVTLPDGNRYGVTPDGGPPAPGALPANANGAVFRITPDGVLEVLHAFSINDPAYGWGPTAALAAGPDGHLYGTTEFGGTHCAECGTIFRITPDGDHAVLHSFNGDDGARPRQALVAGSDGRLHGVTDGGATGVATHFSISPAGDFRVEETAAPDTGTASLQALSSEMLSRVQTFDPDVFPAEDTALIDDFDREDSNDLGPGWTVLPADYGFGPTQVEGIQGSAIIVSREQIDTPHVSGRVQGSDDVIGGNYWNTSFDADQEVYGLFFNSEYDTFGLVVRYDPTTGNGYAVDYNAGVTLYRVIDNEFQDPPLAQTFEDQLFDDPDNVFVDPFVWLGLRAAGDTISVWVSGDRVEWTKILEANDSLVAGGGHVGLHLYHRFQYFDSIYAGNLDIPPPVDDGDGGDGGGNGGDDGDDGGDDGDGGDGADPDVIDDDPVSRPTGSPGGGRRGGIGLGATGPEALAFLLLLCLQWGRTTASRCISSTTGRKVH